MTNGMRGTGDYPGNQRPTNFGKSVKTAGRGRVTREDVENAMRNVHNKVPRNVKKTGKTGKAKEKMLRAIGFSKARRGK